MWPAGMSSDEDEDDDYFSMNIISTKNDHYERQPKAVEYLPPDHSCELRTLLDNSTKSSLFHKAAEEADLRRMDELLENGVSVDGSKMNEWTPLMKACSEGKHEVVHFLLEKGANPNLHKELFTPLMACCMENYSNEMDRLECARLLIQSGANVNAADKHKSTALMMASGNGLASIVDELLNSPGIDINMEDKERWNALFYAVQYNNKSVVEKLVNAGISVNTVNRHGEYGAIELAEMKNHKDIVKFLKEFKSEALTEESVAGPISEFTFDVVRYSLCDFRNQFPEETGKGGFSRDVRDIFAGVGLEKLYDKLKIDVAFPDFLAGGNLAEIGIKYEGLRRKLRKGIHRYHVAPWANNSLHPVHTLNELRMENYIQAISNLTKHLAIMNATLNYVKTRIGNWEGKTCAAFDTELIHLLVKSYVDIQKTKKFLFNMSEIADKIKCTEEVEADFVGPQEIRLGSEGNWKSRLLKAGIASSIIYLLYKFRFS